jgi:hypothetical protein
MDLGCFYSRKARQVVGDQSGLKVLQSEELEPVAQEELNGRHAERSAGKSQPSIYASPSNHLTSRCNEPKKRLSGAAFLLINSTVALLFTKVRSRPRPC